MSKHLDSMSVIYDEILLSGLIADCDQGDKVCFYAVSLALHQWVHSFFNLSINPKHIFPASLNTVSKWGIFQFDTMLISEIEDSTTPAQTTTSWQQFWTKKLPWLRQLHGLAVMERVQKQKHLITIISFLLLARSTILGLLLIWQPPWSSCHEVFLHVLTVESFLLFAPN